MADIKECKPDDPQWQTIPAEPLPVGYLTKNFSLQELTYSQTAARRGINNSAPANIQKNLQEAAEKLWQPVRDTLGVPVTVTSGYRSPALNKAVGGSQTSAHSHGFAIDLKVHSIPNTRILAQDIIQIMKDKGLKFDQLICEFPSGSPTDPTNPSLGSWIHLGYKSPTGAQRGQVLTAVKRNGRTVYLQGLH